MQTQNYTKIGANLETQTQPKYSSPTISSRKRATIKNILPLFVCSTNKIYKFYGLPSFSPFLTATSDSNVQIVKMVSILERKNALMSFY